MKWLAVLLLTLSPITTAGGSVVDIGDFIKATNPRLTEEEAKEMAWHIYRSSVPLDMDPRLLAAVAYTESRFNPKATGAKGEIGLCQIRPEYHLSYLPLEERVAVLYHGWDNLWVASRYLVGLKIIFEGRYPNFLWVEFYNRGPSAKPKKFPYANRVKKVYLQLGGQL